MQRGLLLILLVVGIGAPTMAAPDGDTEEVPVAFDGDEEIILEEGETLEEEVDFGDEEEVGEGTGFAAMIPEYEYDRRLLALPAMLALLLVWNVRWRRIERHPRPRRGERRRQVKGRRRTTSPHEPVKSVGGHEQ